MILRRLLVTTALFVSPISMAETCDGVVSLLRISNYVDGGSASGLEEASRAHQQWYRDHGVSDNEQVVIPIMKPEEGSDTLSIDATRVATLHVNAPASSAVDRDEARNDEGWKQFVAMYDKNTKVTEQYVLCVPQSVLAN